MSSTKSSTSTKSTGRKSAVKSTGRKTAAKTTGRKTGAKTTKSTGRKSAAPVVTAPVATSSPVAFATTDERWKFGSQPRRFDDHAELAKIATKRFQSSGSGRINAKTGKPADPKAQSGVTTANIADAVAALKSRKLTADKLVGVPVADVIRYAETGELTKRAQTGELVAKLRAFSTDTFGSSTKNKLRGKRIAALVSVLMDGGSKAHAAKSAAVASRTFTTTKRSTGRKTTTTKSSGRKGGAK